MTAPSYVQGLLPEPLASKWDAVVLLGEERFPVHSQIVSLHSPVLAELLAGEPAEATAAAEQPPAYRLPEDGGGAAAGEAHTPRTAARSYDPRRRPVLGPESFGTFLAFCYGRELELGAHVSPLGKLLDVAELLGCRSLAATVDCRLTAVLLQDGLADTAGAGSLATKHRLVGTMSAVLPLLSHRRPGHLGSWRGSDAGYARDWEAAFNRLDAECKRMAFALARASPEEKEELGLGDLGAAAAYCREALVGSGWAERRGRSPGRESLEQGSPGSPGW